MIALDELHKILRECQYLSIWSSLLHLSKKKYLLVHRVLMVSEIIAYVGQRKLCGSLSRGFICQNQDKSIKRKFFFYFLFFGKITTSDAERVVFKITTTAMIHATMKVDWAHCTNHLIPIQPSKSTTLKPHLWAACSTAHSIA